MRRAPEYSGPRVEADGERASEGGVVWSPVKSLWYSGMASGWLILGLLYFSWSAVGVFLAASAVTLCGGHSIGMHRKLIHQSFDCPDWLEKIGVYLGVLVGLGGPFSMMRTHDMRDWAQRQPVSHDYYGHRRPFLQDAWWQIHCDLRQTKPIPFRFPSELTQDRFYVWLQRTSMLQQLPWAVLFFLLGGWGWVAWGVCGRVTISITGHWMVGHFAHTHAGCKAGASKAPACRGMTCRFAG